MKMAARGNKARKKRKRQRHAKARKAADAAVVSPPHLSRAGAR
jgi:hypothetical protein